MKLLVVNPNISNDVTELIGAEARRAAAPGTEVVLRTGRCGVEYIETGFEALIAAGTVAEIVAEAADDVDAVLVAAFGDPGLPALKELTGVPTIGITEAALSAASLLGPRFSIIAISVRITSWYRDCVERNGLGGRLASIRSIDQALSDIATVQDDHGATLLELARRAVAEDGADVVILAGAPLAGLGRELADRIPVPVVDGIAAGVALSEALVGLRPRAARAGATAPPPRKRRQGLSPALDRALERAEHAATQETVPAGGAL